MLLATLENMEKCKDIPGVVALNIETGEELSATAKDYFFLSEDEPIYSHNGTQKEPLILAVKICYWIDPLSGENITRK